MTTVFQCLDVMVLLDRDLLQIDGEVHICFQVVLSCYYVYN